MRAKDSLFHYIRSFPSSHRGIHATSGFHIPATFAKKGRGGNVLSPTAACTHPQENDAQLWYPTCNSLAKRSYVWSFIERSLCEGLSTDLVSGGQEGSRMIHAVGWLTMWRANRLLHYEGSRMTNVEGRWLTMWRASRMLNYVEGGQSNDHVEGSRMISMWRVSLVTLTLRGYTPLNGRRCYVLEEDG